MATIIKVDGTRETLDLTNEDTRLDRLQKAVGGYIEAVCTDREGNMVFANEEGLSQGLPHNELGSIISGRPIVGAIVVTTPEENE